MRKLRTIGLYFTPGFLVIILRLHIGMIAGTNRIDLN